MRAIDTVRCIVAASILLSGAAASAATFVAVKPDAEATLEVRKLIDRGHCKAAIEELKPGLKARQSDLLQLAGNLYEEGICVAPDWNKAVAMYMLADTAGHPAAAIRLIAGYARTGRDHGMALWWAARRKQSLRYPAPCLPRANPDGDLEADLEAFNAELERMPVQLFRGCVYLAGVSAELHSRVIFPTVPSYNGIAGTVAMRFDAARGTISWTQEQWVDDERQPAGVRDLAHEGLSNPRAIKRSLLTYLEERGRLALAQYQRPDGDLDPALIVETRYQFKLK